MTVDYLQILLRIWEVRA